jgi:hypothetical protein
LAGAGVAVGWVKVALHGRIREPKFVEAVCGSRLRREDGTP